MIPIKLALRNFMCYRDNVPPLHFDSFHVACLSGDNGNGKSALLDAITWALWGKARAKSDDDLIHLGQAEMEVEFDFAVAENQYRAIRKRSKAGLKRSGQSSLDLLIAGSDGLALISGNSIRETETRIADLLRMDYDTFINSALLLQGRADEFSMKRPGERKEVLANILGLSVYDGLEKLAKSHGKERDIRQQEFTNRLARIDQQLEQKGTLESELRDAEAALAATGIELERQESVLTGLRQSREAFRFKEEEHKALGKQIEQAQQQLRYFEGQFTGHSSRIEGYEKTLATYEEDSARIRKRLDEIAGREAGLAARREQIEELSNRTHFLRSANTKLKEEMDDLKAKIDLLAQGQADCPLCGTELGEDGRERIVANYEAQGTEKGDACRANLAEIQEKEAALKSVRQEVSDLESSITAERTQCERRLEALERDRSQAEQALPQESEALDQARRAAQDSRTALQESEDRQKVILVELEALPDLEKELDSAEKAFRELRERDRAYRDRLADLQASLRRCAELETERQDITTAMRTAADERSIYEELATAFGKRGVQALIIESALPAIEEEANRLLGRMTDNRMHVRIESQRDTKKGETVETLEIRIADELGTRNYEMFSGGEAFRVNFALRIALSKLLAGRSGAPLPTLIIDEGFGTQDSSGRERLVEAINSIQDDFDKILVITHIEELKDAFPVRIEITKTEDGSTFSLN
jgi:exonuclease SbcC